MAQWLQSVGLGPGFELSRVLEQNTLSSLKFWLIAQDQPGLFRLTRNQKASFVLLSLDVEI